MRKNKIVFARHSERRLSTALRLSPEPAEGRIPKGEAKNLMILFVFACCAVIFTCFNLSSFAQEEYIYKPQGLRDPFSPLVTPDGRLVNLDVIKGVTVLKVEGIIYDKRPYSYAVVNGLVVKTGDEIDGYQVLKIEKEKVIFVKDGKTLEAELKKGGE